MHRLILATFVVLAPLAASAQQHDMNAYNQALASLNAGRLEDAASRFFESLLALLRSSQLGKYSPSSSRVKKPLTSLSVLGSSLSVSFTSQVTCRHGPNTAFS